MLQFMGLQRVGHDLVTEQHHTFCVQENFTGAGWPCGGMARALLLALNLWILLACDSLLV